jgi:sterol desaturase/sphingolipid hydroxylase (fatty acid hydroxylase superfamily)
MQSSNMQHSGEKPKGVIFENNPTLEKLTHTNSFLPITLYAGLAIGFLAYALVASDLPILRVLLFFVSGLITFTLVEYFVHKYAYHMDDSTPSRAKLQYTLHGVHHEDPKDKSRLAMPVPMGLALAAIFFIIFYLILGYDAIAFFPGFVLGNSAYLFIHYAVHAYPPPKNMLKQLWFNHSIHHYMDHNKCYGVTSPLWDYVFGTMHKVENKAK